MSFPSGALNAQTEFLYKYAIHFDAFGVAAVLEFCAVFDALLLEAADAELLLGTEVGAALGVGLLALLGAVVLDAGNDANCDAEVCMQLFNTDAAIASVGKTPSCTKVCNWNPFDNMHAAYCVYGAQAVSTDGLG